jgi:HEAT repeat protein
MNMYTVTRLLIATFVLLAANSAYAQDEDTSDKDQLKIVALEALITAPPERALPRVRKILEGTNSDEVKESALFILSQIDLPEAQALLVETAMQTSGELQVEAIQMIGIGGDPTALSELSRVYEAGDIDVREAVLEAYMIADNVEGVMAVAMTTEVEEEFEAAVEMLAVMDATEELRGLRNRPGMSANLVQAFIISDDSEMLLEMAMDGSNREQQIEAIEALGIVDAAGTGTTLVEIYEGTDDEEIREAALSGMLIADYDEGVLELYRSSQDPGEKSELLQYLTIMDSDAIWEIIDAALEDER